LQFQVTSDVTHPNGILPVQTPTGAENPEVNFLVFINSPRNEFKILWFDGINMNIMKVVSSSYSCMQDQRELRWSPGQSKMWGPHSTTKAI
jgi:hypothetical protein